MDHVDDAFEKDVLKESLVEKGSPYNRIGAINLADRSEDICFIKTKFHNRFLKVLALARKGGEEKQRFVGIQGIGKSTTAKYYVLSCRRNGDFGVHYVDLAMINTYDEHLQTFTEYVNLKVKHADCLVVDNVTLLNNHFVKKIEEIEFFRKIILIETGFTACSYKSSLYFNKSHQLNEEDFEKIWSGTLSLKKIDFSDVIELINSSMKIAKLVYSELNNTFIVTPKILHQALDNILIYGKNIREIAYEAEIRLREQIINFKVDVEDSQYKQFILHTKALLDCLDTKTELICKPSDLKHLNVAINLFDVKHCVVTPLDMLDLEKYCRLMELELEEGDHYVTLSHLIPLFAKQWKYKFPFQIKEFPDISNGDFSVLEFCFRSGGQRKRLVNQLVECQIKNNFVIIPDKISFNDTCVFQKRSRDLEYKLSDGVIKPRKLFSFKPHLGEFEEIQIDDSIEGLLRNVHRTALYIKEKIELHQGQSIMVHPAIDNLIGFDYFLYTQHVQRDSENNIDSKDRSSKRIKIDGTLYLVLVSPGETHTGNTMAKALSVFRELMQGVTIHVIVYIVRRQRNAYSLTGKFCFSDISFVNLAASHLSNSMKVYSDELGCILEAIIRAT